MRVAACSGMGLSSVAMTKLASLLCLVAALSIAPCGTRANHIALSVDSVAEYIDGVAAVGVGITNLGDEPACRVRAYVSVGALHAETPIRAALANGESYDEIIELAAEELPAGRHVVVCRVVCEDGRGKALSAIHTTELLKGEKEPADSVDVTVSDATLRREGTLVVGLTSLATQALPVKLSLVLPDELQCDAPTTSVTLDAGGKSAAQFPVRNVGSLPGSEYTVYVLAETTVNGPHNGRSFTAVVSIPEPWHTGLTSTRNGAVLAVLLLLLTILTQILRPARARTPGERVPAWLPAIVLAVVYAYLILQLPVDLLFADTTTVGGDTPAHNYMAGHLATQLFSHGRLVSWSDGWWCGFPLFQFYFTLPYVLTALLSKVMAFNVAFKLVSLLGVFLLPAAPDTSGRLMKLRRPMPSLLAVASLALLFDRSNTMFGVNLYSTLAGMISNSLSFPMMLLFLGAFWRDLDDGRFRLSTVLFLVAMVASHFFTSIMAALVLPVMLLLRPSRGVKRALAIATAEGSIGLLCMAWWIVPLLAKRGFGIDFGENWKLDFLLTLSPFVYTVPVVAVASLACAWKLRSRYMAVMGWMLLVATFLFVWGYDRVSAVFVNVRLWPFMAWAALAIAAAGAGALIARLKAPVLATAALLVTVLAFGIGQPNHVRDWATWNYGGLERKPRYDVFEKLVLPLKGTPGRLANDLHDDNNKYLGSSRVFECVPHLTGKPILEGGIVNSAAGSLFSYYVQGETSDNCAGFPTMVTPTNFDITNATRHMELFNIKHFVARSERTRDALDASPDWRKLGECDDWASYELTTHDGRYVYVPEKEPVFVFTRRWKEAGLEWIYTIDLLGQPYALLPGGTPLPAGRSPQELYHASFVEHTRDVRENGLASSAETDQLGSADPITQETVSANRIRFTTTAIGRPHIIKMTYFPNWKVRGADRVYMVTPCFMLVYPAEEEVELYYGYTISDRVGHVLTVVGWLALVSAIVRTRRRVKRDSC